MRGARADNADVVVVFELPHVMHDAKGTAAVVVGIMFCSNTSVVPAYGSICRVCLLRKRLITTRDGLDLDRRGTIFGMGVGSDEVIVQEFRTSARYRHSWR